ncbi:MAG: lytic murein transglycosylase [Marinagarivorans sp.]|nr:lytic murein transglycosylase [Marinagarivorans sp.]
MKILGVLLSAICLMSLSACAQTTESLPLSPQKRQQSTIAPQEKITAQVAVQSTSENILPIITEAIFASCLADYASKAAAAGISQNTMVGPLANAKLNSRVLELDGQQPEFTTSFANYFNRRVNDQRVEQGRALLQKHRALFDKIEQQYGVPAPYLLSFWGLETNFGSFFGNMPVVDSLATLACEGRRAEFFTGELIAALRILDEGAIEPAKMVGSWAGAMGHVQFMPSNFLRYAIDGDGDGKRNLWASTPDAMASAANFLQGLGWQSDDRWGREVKLPSQFNFLAAGLNNTKPLAEWSKLGVRRADNSPLPQSEIKAALLVPAGHQGPAFLVYHNFNVIMRWNRSEFYAVAVGVLADRIAGAGNLLQSPPVNALRLHRSQVLQLQEKLIDRELYADKADGIFGPATRRAVSQYQQQNNFVADGFPDEKLLRLLGVSLEAVKN